MRKDCKMYCSFVFIAYSSNFNGQMFPRGPVKGLLLAAADHQSGLAASQ